MTVSATDAVASSIAAVASAASEDVSIASATDSAPPATAAAGAGASLSSSTDGTSTSEASALSGDGAVAAAEPPIDEIALAIDAGGVEARESKIPGAGLGLFSTRAYAMGDVICIYTGKPLRTVQAMRLEDKSYLMRLGPQVYADAGPCMDVMARYINDCRVSSRYNVTFVKQPAHRRALVTATRDVAPGDELYVDYGKWYWAKLKPNKLGEGD